MAASIRLSLAERLVPWLPAAFSMACSFSSIVPVRDSIASTIISSPDGPSTRDSLMADSMRASLVSRLNVCPFREASTAASISSIVPSVDSIAVWISASCAFPSARPSFMAASISPSLSSRLEVRLFRAVSTADNFSASVPERAETAC